MMDLNDGSQDLARRTRPPGTTTPRMAPVPPSLMAAARETPTDTNLKNNVSDSVGASRIRMCAASRRIGVPVLAGSANSSTTLNSKRAKSSRLVDVVVMAIGSAR